MSFDPKIGEGKYVISVDNQGAITQLQNFENAAKRTGENTKKSFETGLRSTVGLASGIASLGFQYDNLDKAQLRVQKSNLEVSRAMEQVRRLEQQGKTGTLDYAQAKERLSIANEKLRQSENDAFQGQVAFGLSIVQTVSTLPNAIKGIQGLTSATKLLDMATSKWTLIAIAAIAAFEGIAHVIKMVNPEIDITIEGMGTRLLGAMNKARGGADELTGSIEDLSKEQKNNQDSSRFFEGNLFNMTTYYDEQNRKLKENIKLLKEKKAAEQEVIQAEKKSSVTNKGTLWDNIIQALTGPLIPMAHAESSAQQFIKIQQAHAGTVPGWASDVFRIYKAPDDLISGGFPDKPFSLTDLYGPALRMARKPKSDALKQIEQSIKDEIKKLTDDQEVIRRQREVSGLLALRDLQRFREEMLIEFVGQEMFDRLRLIELRNGATPDQADSRAREKIKHTSRGEIEVLPNGNFVIRKPQRGSALGGTFFGSAGISGIGKLFGKNFSLSNMTGNESLTLSNLGFGALKAYTDAYGIGGTSTVLGRRQALSGMMGGVSNAVSRTISSGARTARGRSSKHGGTKRGWGTAEVIRLATEGSSGFAAIAARYAAEGFNIPIPQYGLDSMIKGYRSPSNEFLQASIRTADASYQSQISAFHSAVAAAEAEKERRVMSFVSRSGLSRSQVVALQSTQQGTDDLYGIIDYRERLARASTGSG